MAVYPSILEARFPTPTQRLKSFSSSSSVFTVMVLVPSSFSTTSLVRVFSGGVNAVSSFSSTVLFSSSFIFFIFSSLTEALIFSRIFALSLSREDRGERGIFSVFGVKSLYSTVFSSSFISGTKGRWGI